MSRRTTHKPAAEQLALPLSRDARLSLIDQADPVALGIGVRQWPRVRELLRQIEFCGGASEGSHSRVKVLAAKMGVAERTVRRLRKLAVDAGLLSIDERYAPCGAQYSHRWQVQYDRLRAATTERVQEPANRGQSLGKSQMSAPPDDSSAPPDEMSAPPDDSSARIKNHHRSLKAVRHQVDLRAGRSSKDDQRDVDWEQARQDALDVVRKIGRCRNRDDFELALKASALTQRGYTQHWLWDAAEGAVRMAPRKPWGYFWRCLENSAPQGPGRYRFHLAKLEPPDWALAPTRAADLSERLCAVGGGHE